MKYLLSRASRAILSRLARERTLCAFDFDGTLAPIVAHPRDARLSRRTRRLLGLLASRYPCVIVSGRARLDALGKMRGAGVMTVIGNHGAERAGSSRRLRSRVTRWKAILDQELRDLPGVWIEDKGLSLAVHYRQSSRKATARKRIAAAAGKLERVRVFGGKQVVNLVGDSAPNKGAALTAERNRARCNWVFYAGDDENDEEAFAISGNIVAVRIGRRQRSKAGYYLRSRSELDEVLERLILEAAPHDRRRPSAPRTK